MAKRPCTLRERSRYGNGHATGTVTLSDRIHDRISNSSVYSRFPIPDSRFPKIANSLFFH
ncbi:MAG: hypothetical protein F6K65_26990 [Moorea sp. SIO3C2]|nr:hypothetical protein [Moorena sp. SIO3C2]